MLLERLSSGIEVIIPVVIAKPFASVGRSDSVGSEGLEECREEYDPCRLLEPLGARGKSGCSVPSSNALDSVLSFLHPKNDLPPDDCRDFVSLLERTCQAILAFWARPASGGSWACAEEGHAFLECQYPNRCACWRTRDSTYYCGSEASFSKDYTIPPLLSICVARIERGGFRDVAFGCKSPQGAAWRAQTRRVFCGSAGRANKCAMMLCDDRRRHELAKQWG